jgi:tetratricopeptide (TPR) repeat protein
MDVGEIDVKRYNGWKAIAGHFRRDRTTVMRWAQTRDLPIHRVPGSGSSSVYAFSDELDTWLSTTLLAADDEDARATKADAATDAQIVVDHPPEKPTTKRAALAIVAGLAAIGLGGSVAFGLWNKKNPKTAMKQQLPLDPALAEIYLQAKSDWASRTPDGLHRAVDGFTKVTRGAPRFAPGFAALADAYLLVREFDATPDAVAYPRAQAAAETALALDANMPAAHRALGFIDYWWHRDIPKARAAFAAARRQDPQSAQTHFWYGNILTDNGEADAGLRELDLARLLEPSTQAIQIDYLWALWSSGHYDLAKQKLVEAGAKLNSPSPFTYLSYVALAQRDWQGYLSASARRASLRDDNVLEVRVAKEKAAFAAGGAKGMLDLMAQNTVFDPAAVVSDTSWSACLAALAGDRAKLLRILQLAEQRGEVWGFSGFTGPVFAPLQADPEIKSLLAARKGASMQST